LIIEDDCIFLDNFDNVLKHILEFDLQYDMFYLNRFSLNEIYNLGDEVEINDKIIIPKYSYNASSYILTYNGAKKLLDANLLKHFLPIDEFLPIMYDFDYPHKKYSCYFDKYPKNKTFALKNDIAYQESREKFPSDVEDSEIYLTA
jgi:collagen beta-1,O-galactosyltransferase